MTTKKPSRTTRRQTPDQQIAELKKQLLSEKVEKDEILKQRDSAYTQLVSTITQERKLKIQAHEALNLIFSEMRILPLSVNNTDPERAKNFVEILNDKIAEEKKSTKNRISELVNQVCLLQETIALIVHHEI